MESKEEVKDKLKHLLDADETDIRAIFKLSNELSKFDDRFQRFFVDAKTLIHLGRDSIKDHATALIELVKNSYDADSHNVEIEILCNNGSDIIRVADNGFGMSKDELFNNWLRIGFSKKRKEKTSGYGRRRTGEKGIGRISTDRLGAELELITKTKEDGIIGLKVNWDEFDKEGKDIFDINVEVIHPESINIPDTNGVVSDTGTEIKITKLRQTWTPNNIINLFNELSSLTPPFNEVEDFVINLKNDVLPSFSTRVNSDFYNLAEIQLTAIYDGKGPNIIYSIKDKYTNNETTSIVEWKTLLQKIGIIPKDFKGYVEDLKCGPVTIKLLFFLRTGASVASSDFKLSDLREFLDTNVGVKIYRDNIAVKPYGFSNSQFGYDWLDLAERKAKNPAGISRAEDYKVTPNQLIGAVFISRDTNIALSDSAAREGLIESESFYELRNLTLASINMLESYRSKLYPSIEKKEQNKKTKKSFNEEAEQINQKLIDVKGGLNTLKETIEKGGAEIKPVQLLKPLSNSIEQVDTISNEVNNTITGLLNWQRVLGGLATIGISSAVFGHETENAMSAFRIALDNAISEIEEFEPDLDIVNSELNKAVKNSNKISAWGAFALTRVQKEKRSKKPVNIKKTVENVVKELRPVFEAASILLKVEGDSLVTKTYQMDIESLLINLLTNSYTACTQNGDDRKVLINISREDLDSTRGYKISVSDSGPGIADEHIHRIFEPLFSTKAIATNQSKSIGTGLGLTVVKSIVDDLKGNIKVNRDTVLKGALFEVWLPIEK
ncbi:sensor histidine kinase [Adhaeribacter radiodurans]|uniref:histidine kinase n=1 Tax=Adhaeribacter radiodurans TaxID=2745197 RepID=A0A7L7L4G8_9BACT|nr:sensor histidine kinase [Adhaeribacter radiodurans]QMU27697.1 sensor histidine kinase [Adhaeribacter radiodurans]